MENEDKGKGLTLSPSTCIRKEDKQHCGVVLHQPLPHQIMSMLLA